MQKSDVTIAYDLAVKASSDAMETIQRTLSLLDEPEAQMMALGTTLGILAAQAETGYAPRTVRLAYRVSFDAHISTTPEEAEKRFATGKQL